jgi:hypothetical protein
LQDLDDVAFGVVMNAATTHKARWRFVLRERVSGSGIGDGIHAARLLEVIGERPDIRVLRAYARRQRRLSGASLLGKALARRLADRVSVEDQNRIAIRVAERLIPGSAVRRKVLALLCFLLTKPDLTSTRDQVLEALWPDLDPLDAVNSLNQTVYFLRRVVEEDYVDDLSPGYLHHDSDLIWLDRDLVTSRSNECRALIKALPPLPSPDQVQDLADRYPGRSPWTSSTRMAAPYDWRMRHSWRSWSERSRATSKPATSIAGFASRDASSTSTQKPSRSRFRCFACTGRVVLIRPQPSSTGTTRQ